MNEIQEIINFIKTDFTESKIELGKDTIKVTTLKNKKTFNRNNLPIKDLYMLIGDELRNEFYDFDVVLSYYSFAGGMDDIKNGIKFYVTDENNQIIKVGFTSSVSEEQDWIYYYLNKYVPGSADKSQIPENLLKEYDEVRNREDYWYDMTSEISR